MNNHFKRYSWKEGVPKGLELLEEFLVDQGSRSFKIIKDPYGKRISLEQYEKGIFIRTLYDSALLDFRKLDAVEQLVWERRSFPNSQDSFIRNQEDRVVCLERYCFEENLCRSCQIFSPHELLLATQRIYYKILGDSFNGVILFDPLDQPIMFKKYEVDESGHLFTQVIEEEWDMLKNPLLLFA